MTDPNIAWIDVETDGLKPGKHSLLEIAYLVTDSDLNILDETGFHAVVYYPPLKALGMRNAAHPFVREMHDKTGLWNKLSGVETNSLKEIDRDLRSYLSKYSYKPNTMPVGGNSVRLDMNFMDKFLPKTSGLLSHQMRDVTTVAKLAQAWYPDLPEHHKLSDHTAMLDIAESIRELKHYREVAFKAKFADMQQSERDEVTSDVMRLLLDRGYSITAPGGAEVVGFRNREEEGEEL